MEIRGIDFVSVHNLVIAKNEKSGWQSASRF